jgi:hypothetical protein
MDLPEYTVRVVTHVVVLGDDSDTLSPHLDPRLDEL